MAIDKKKLAAALGVATVGALAAPEAYARYQEHMGDKAVDELVEKGAGTIKKVIRNKMEEDPETAEQLKDQLAIIQKDIGGVDPAQFGERVAKSGSKGAIKQILKDRELLNSSKTIKKALESKLTSAERAQMEKDYQNLMGKIPPEYQGDVEGLKKSGREIVERYGRHYVASHHPLNVFSYFRK